MKDESAMPCHLCALGCQGLGSSHVYSREDPGAEVTVYRSNLSSPQAVKNETGHYGTELYTEIAERIIETHNASEPLYLYLAQQGVHSANERDPLQAPPRLLDVSQN